MIGTRMVVGGSMALLLGLAGVSQHAHHGDAPRMHGPRMRPAQTFRHPGLEGVMMTPDGTRVVSWSKDGVIRVWDLGAPGAPMAQAWPPPPPPGGPHWPPPPPPYGWGGPGMTGTGAMGSPGMFPPPPPWGAPGGGGMPAPGPEEQGMPDSTPMPPMPQMPQPYPMGSDTPPR